MQELLDTPKTKIVPSRFHLALRIEAIDYAALILTAACLLRKPTFFHEIY